MEVSSIDRLEMVNDKVEYGDACYVVLCVHDDKIPILEWYHTEEAVSLHQPFKVLDLLFATYVIEVGSDPRAFVVGLKELEAIELVAISPNFSEVCLEWVDCLTATLHRLSILVEASNIYIPTPRFKVDMSRETSPRHKVRCRDAHSLNRTSHIHSPQALRPPLPPRAHQVFPYRPLTLATSDEMREETTYDVLRARSHVSCDDEKEANWYDIPKGYYNPLSRGASLSNMSSSPMDSTLSTTSLCSSLSSALRLWNSIPPEDISASGYANVRSELNMPNLKVRSVALNLSVLIEHVMFVQVEGRVWVAGWSEIRDRQLSLMFNVGDELIEVENVRVKGFASVIQLFYTLSTPGTPVNLLLKRIPLGKKYRLMKPISKNKEIGIQLHKNKNRIASVIPDSLADRRHLPVSMESPFKPGMETAVVITEVNNRRLNPFSKNGQLFKRLEEIRDGSEFEIVLHPHDFIKLMKEQIVNFRHYKSFLCHP
ncbi:unnamed protein product [Angiostrongylus costaricensis]|uniref:PDZ domain-containing protein n=1 Tax=Angiostrongylus costaricensis TaxID=334426 RepID=A0A158PJF5_ANGCS|nr:unnamed protein product [Angiostrongylus costaricensis]